MARSASYCQRRCDGGISQSVDSQPGFSRVARDRARGLDRRRALTTPPVSVVKYTNGIAWTVDQSRLTVTENCGPAFRDHYESHGLVLAYLEKLPHVPYRGLGLNCQVSTLQPDPLRWLVERFAVNWLRDDPQVHGMRPAFALNAGDAVCNIAFEEATRDDGPCVAAECNLHHPGPLDVDGHRAAIARWNERQRFIVSALDRLLESQPRS